MPRNKSPVIQFDFSKMDVAAMSFAVLLSLACLARGAVYDGLIALLLLLNIPILFVVLHRARALHPLLVACGALLFASVLTVLILQWRVMPAADGMQWWQQALDHTEAPNALQQLYDKAAWLQGLGRVLLLFESFVIALCIGSSESSSRLFLQSLMISGSLCLAATFMIATANGIPTTAYYFYTHGFVNSNNAATYLGVMLLLVMMQSRRFFRLPSTAGNRMLLDVIDQVNFMAIVNGFFLLFSMLLILAGLFMTGSRAGVIFSLACAFLFSAIVALKTNLKSRTKKAITTTAFIVIAVILVWSFINFGDIFMRRMERDGTGHSMRSGIFSAVIPMIKDHLWLGTGLGGFPAMFQQYRPMNLSTEGAIDKAHNTYLEFTSELGLPVFLVLLAIVIRIGFMLFNGARKRKERYLTPALGFCVWSLAALHSLVDFPLQIPGLAALFIAIIAVSASQTDPRFSEPANASSTVPIRRVRIRKKRGSSGG